MLFPYFLSRQIRVFGAFRIYVVVVGKVSLHSFCGICQGLRNDVSHSIVTSLIKEKDGPQHFLKPVGKCHSATFRRL